MTVSSLEKNVTLLIKAFERPKAVANLYDSIRKFYPKIKIVIVDDSKESMDISIFDKNVNYIHADFDIGLSAGRNLGLRKINTKYFVLLDDDFLFTENTKLEDMYDTLEDKCFHLISGGVHDFGTKQRRFFGVFKQKNNVLYLMEGRHKGLSNGMKCYDFAINFFMADTNFIKENLWDEELKLGEHEDFFYRLSKKDALITDISEQVFLEHYPEEMGNYKEYKSRVWALQKYAANKNGFKRFEKVLKGFSYPALKSKLKVIIPDPVVALIKKLKGKS